jgi:hypothetical protein
MQTRPPSATTTLEKHQQQRVPRIYSIQYKCREGKGPFGWLQLLLKGKRKKIGDSGQQPPPRTTASQQQPREKWAAAAFGTRSPSPSRNWRSCLREATKGGRCRLPAAKRQQSRGSNLPVIVFCHFPLAKQHENNRTNKEFSE